MANRRNIGRGRIPFRKGKRWISNARPKRWGAVTDVVVDEPIGSEGAILTVIPSALTEFTEGSLPVETLLDGEFDVATWADEQEVLIDRVVGTISLVGDVSRSETVFIFPPPAIVRLGIVVHEDKTADLTADDPRRKLFDQNDLQETEWMWLKQVTLCSSEDSLSQGESLTQPYAYQVAMDIDIDLRNRRKLGQRDQLFLYAQYVFPNFTSGLGGAYVWNVRISQMLRIIMVSK